MSTRLSVLRRHHAPAVVVLAGALVVGGVAGSAAALWSDHVTVSGDVGTGSVVFAVSRDAGSDVTSAHGPDDVLELTLGPAEAWVLAETGELALPIRVDALAQGNLGLTYEVHLPELGTGTILGAADLVLVRVADPSGCVPRASLPAPGASTSMPVPTTYDAGTTPVTEHWCLLGRLDELPRAGTYTNTGTVHADSEYGTVTDSDTWTADLLLNPAHEPAAALRFVHKTVRPGG